MSLGALNEHVCLAPWLWHGRTDRPKSSYPNCIRVSIHVGSNVNRLVQACGHPRRHGRYMLSVARIALGCSPCISNGSQGTHTVQNDTRPTAALSTALFDAK